jgi:hypothetical protein
MSTYINILILKCQPNSKKKIKDCDNGNFKYPKPLFLSANTFVFVQICYLASIQLNQIGCIYRLLVMSSENRKTFKNCVFILIGLPLSSLKRLIDVRIRLQNRKHFSIYIGCCKDRFFIEHIF